jgi:predicted ATPase
VSGPLVLVIDDLQWAERTFLELVEHIVYLSRSAPILLVGLARSEFLEGRPEWPGPRIRLEPLLGADAEAFMDRLAGERTIGEDVRARIANAAEGNPLFIEQMLAMLEGDGSDVAVPPTISALLAARVDQLEAPQRRAIECASVVGQQFWSGAVRDLSGDDAAIGRALIDLVRLEFVVPDVSVTFPNEDTFRFVHILVRDAAYEAMPKELRASYMSASPRGSNAKTKSRAYSTRRSSATTSSRRTDTWRSSGRSAGAGVSSPIKLLSGCCRLPEKRVSATTCLPPRISSLAPLDSCRRTIPCV